MAPMASMLLLSIIGAATVLPHGQGLELFPWSHDNSDNFVVNLFDVNGKEIATGSGPMKKSSEIFIDFEEDAFTVAPKPRKLGIMLWNNAKDWSSVKPTRSVNILSSGSVTLTQNPNGTVEAAHLLPNGVVRDRVTVAEVVIVDKSGNERVFQAQQGQLEAALERGIKFQIPPEVQRKSGEFQFPEFAALVGALSKSRASGHFKMTNQKTVSDFLAKFYENDKMAARKEQFYALEGRPVPPVEKSFEKEKRQHWERQQLVKTAAEKRDENLRSIGALLEGVGTGVPIKRTTSLPPVDGTAVMHEFQQKRHSLKKRQHVNLPAKRKQPSFMDEFEEKNARKKKRLSAM